GSRSFDSNAARANLFGAAMMKVPLTATTGCDNRIHACCCRVSTDASVSSAVTADQTAARSWSVTFAIPHHDRCRRRECRRGTHYVFASVDVVLAHVAAAPYARMPPNSGAVRPHVFASVDMCALD